MGAECVVFREGGWGACEDLRNEGKRGGEGKG